MVITVLLLVALCLLQLTINLQPVYTSALDRNCLTWFKLSHIVNTNQTAPNHTAPNRTYNPRRTGSNRSDPAPGVNAIEQRGQTNWAHETGCHARVDQNGYKFDRCGDFSVLNPVAHLHSVNVHPRSNWSDPTGTAT